MIPFRFTRAGYIPPRGVQGGQTVSTEVIDNEIARAANAVAEREHFPPSYPPPGDVPRAPQVPEASRVNANLA
eukprot:4260026-Karenia_brevis.AAC.1